MFDNLFQRNLIFYSLGHNILTILKPIDFPEVVQLKFLAVRNHLELMFVMRHNE